MVRETVGVETLADRWVAGLALLVLVEDPFQGRTAAQAVFPCFGRDAGKRRLLIQSDDVAFLVRINTLKPQLFIDTIFIPKRTRKRMKSGPSRKSTRPSQKKSAHAPKPQPSTRKQKPALTRQERKEQGLCRCGQAAVQGQTRCAECAVKHREWTRQDSENRRRAKGIKPRPRFDDAELIEQIQKEIADQETRGASQTPKRVRSEEYKKKNQQHRAQVRAERKSLGLCVQCAKPSLAGQIRCADCVLKHRQYELHSRVKAKLTAEQ